MPTSPRAPNPYGPSAETDLDRRNAEYVAQLEARRAAGAVLDEKRRRQSNVLGVVAVLLMLPGSVGMLFLTENGWALLATFFVGLLLGAWAAVLGAMLPPRERRAPTDETERR